MDIKKFMSEIHSWIEETNLKISRSFKGTKSPEEVKERHIEVRKIRKEVYKIYKC